MTFANLHALAPNVDALLPTSILHVLIHCALTNLYNRYKLALHAGHKLLQNILRYACILVYALTTDKATASDAVLQPPLPSSMLLQ